MISKSKAILALADGNIFSGTSIGAEGKTKGEVVFNTAMTGYEEILTDPSYKNQIVTLTYPHIGNTGINTEDLESDDVWCSGLIIRDYPFKSSNWRKEEDLKEFLISRNTVAIADIDTRKLTRLIRKKGAQSAAIISLPDIDEDEAIEFANSFGGLAGQDLAAEVSGQRRYILTEPDPIVTTIEVYVNSQLTNNWSYITATNSVTFDNGHLPEEGQTITIDYAIWGCGL